MKKRIPARALAVDDDPHFLANLRLMLRICGFSEVLGAPDVDSAWEILQATPVDLIVSDWNMAPYDGLELLHRVRGDTRRGRTPFILITASLGEQAWRGAISGGASDFLHKPFGLDQLRISTELAMAIEGAPARPAPAPPGSEGATGATIHYLFDRRAGSQAGQMRG